MRSGKPVLAQIDAFERFNPQPHEERYWFVKRSEAGGGPMFDFGCHRLELLLSLFGPVRQTVGLTANVVFDREVEDTAVAVMTFESGPCATVTVTHAAIEPRDTLRVFGTTGSIHVSVLNAGDLVITRQGQEAREAHPPAANLHQPLVEDFVEAVRSGRAAVGRWGGRTRRRRDRSADLRTVIEAGGTRWRASKALYRGVRRARRAIWLFSADSAALRLGRSS